jgi:hypothetical protein
MSQTVNNNVAIPASSPDANSLMGQALNARSTEIDSTDGAIAIKSGHVVITKGSAAAMTLAAPIATTDDFKRLTIFATTGFAHTVTTPANKINGNKLTATFANAGDSLELVAYQGVWYRVNTTTTLS